MNSTKCGTHLVEPGVKFFLKESLKQCNEVKKHHNFLLYNLVGFLFLICIMSAILWFMYKGKLTPVEKALKERKKQEYILEKLRNIPAPQNKSIITNLPKWNE